MTEKLLDSLLNAKTARNKDSATLKAEEDRVLAPLLDEIDLVRDIPLKEFVRSVILRNPIFFKTPASFSGVHHPPDETGPDGTVLHTKRVVRAALILCESQQRTEFEIDIVLAAALLHDLTKGIEGKDGLLHYDTMHPLTIDAAVERALLADEANVGGVVGSSSLLVEPEVVHQVTRLIHCSHGPWGPIPEVCPITSLEWILHFADHLASRVHQIVDGSDVKLERWNLGKG